MDLVELMEEKRFLGQEFLTWLWWKSEERGGAVSVSNYGDIAISFEKHLLLEVGEGESNEKLICSGLQSELREARTGLRMGKKLEQARIVLSRDSHEYSLTLTGSLLEFRNVRLPKTEDTGSNDDAKATREDVEGLILERIFLFEDLQKMVMTLFSMFIEVRLGEQWHDQANAIRHWVLRNATS